MNPAEQLREAGRQMSKLGASLDQVADAARRAAIGTAGAASEVDRLLKIETERRRRRRRELMRYAAFYFGFVIALLAVLIPLS